MMFKREKAVRACDAATQLKEGYAFDAMQAITGIPAGVLPYP